VRTSEDATWSVRFDFEGTRAESWCNIFATRDEATDVLYTSYAEAAGFGCATGGADGRRSVLATYDGDLNAVDDAFPFEFIHERIRAEL
jgi:hypothetical protein